MIIFSSKKQIISQNMSKILYLSLSKLSFLRSALSILFATLPLIKNAPLQECSKQLWPLKGLNFECTVNGDTKSSRHAARYVQQTPLHGKKPSSSTSLRSPCPPVYASINGTTLSSLWCWKAEWDMNSGSFNCSFDNNPTSKLVDRFEAPTLFHLLLFRFQCDNM